MNKIIKKIKAIKIVHNENGMVSISASIILSLVVMFTLAIYELSLGENDTVEVLKLNKQAENYTISECLNMINKYQNDYNLWQIDTKRAENITEFAEAIIVDEQNLNNDKLNAGDIKITAYLMNYKQNEYRLVVETSFTKKEITNQKCVYLIQKDDDVVVQRWER